VRASSTAWRFPFVIVAVPLVAAALVAGGNPAQAAPAIGAQPAQAAPAAVHEPSATGGAGAGGGSAPAMTPHARGTSPDVNLPVGWTKDVNLPKSFDIRWDASYAYYPPADQVVLFGGSPLWVGDTWMNDTWIYKNGSWTAGPPAPAGLTPRGGAAMAYDPDIQKIVLFGGAGPEWPPVNNDTWLWDGTGWSEGPAAPNAMKPRDGAEMVYDPDIHRLVLFGGSGFLGYDDTWLFDGSQWLPGPATPAGMLPRVHFGMAYDPHLHVIVLAGGDGTTKTWLFDGSSWSQGSDMPADLGAVERVSMDYDPDLGGVVIVGDVVVGTQASSHMWVLRAGEWINVPAMGSPVWPAQRLDNGILWVPSVDAFMVASGIQTNHPEKFGYRDTWLFREVMPGVSDFSIGPNPLLPGHDVVASIGSISGGYGESKASYRWIVNDQSVEGEFTKRLPAGDLDSGDRVQAEVKVTDKAGVSGPWVTSNMLAMDDRPPKIIGRVSLTPTPAYFDDTLQASLDGVEDPDGDTVTLEYAWKVNGTRVQDADDPSLTPDNFSPGDEVAVTVTPEDEAGLEGDPKSESIDIRWNLDAGPEHQDHTVMVSGEGYAPREQVEVHLDDVSGHLLGTVTTDANGAFDPTSFTLPYDLVGGSHPIYGVGKLSEIAGPGRLVVIAMGGLSDSKVAVGQTVIFTGNGFTAGEQITGSFPGGDPVPGNADGNGSVELDLTSPPEPSPGGVVTVTAGSATVTADYKVLPVFTPPAGGHPRDVKPISVTGFGASETVDIRYDGGGVVKSFTTDAAGSGSTQVALPPLFGPHDMTVTGETSGVTQSARLNLDETITISPDHGPQGTVVTVDSGPGWVPNELVDLTFSSYSDRVAADDQGVVHTTFTVPKHAPGVVNVVLTENTYGFRASAPFTVT
jgi:hypothetical protein